ncbi:type II toxin-antitoxin system Phd/YefM family antitoxin [Nocardiopsis sp. LOL_012]|uniref:type II toxin-antitoxin system Phd/YefM family antitoxin n=1 Tax=Nocardiopsis sp. LOL_012 TaxID=3345409 RepID=UPI003A8A73E9
MVILQHTQQISVTDAARRGVAGVVHEAEQGSEVIVTRRGEPVAAVVAFSRLAELERAEADLRDLALVMARALTDDGQRTSLDDVLAAFGHTRASLEELPED